MIPSDRDLIKLGPWTAGANNLALETQVPRGAFRKGVNVDITDSGRVLRRHGRTKVFDGELSGLFGYGARGFFVEGQSLLGFEVLDGAETAAIELYSGLRPGARIAHALVDPDIFVSDGDVCLRISPTNEVSFWSVAAPDAPAVAVASGTLEPGRYHFAVAYRANTGEESALSLPTMAETTEQGGFSVSWMTPPTGMRTAVYMTKPNGTELLHVATVPGTMLGISKQRLGRPPATEDMDPMPGGSFAALWNGRLLTASGRLVTWSEPMQYGVTRLAYNYLELAEEVTGLGAPETSEGYFIGQQSRTYFAAGADPADAVLREVYPAGMVPGTLQMVPGARLPLEAPPAEPVPMWLATNGVFCVGMPAGTVLPLTESKYAAMKADSGAAFFDQRGGISRYVATLRNPTENNFAMTDTVTAEVVRNNLTP